MAGARLREARYVRDTCTSPARHGMPQVTHDWDRRLLVCLLQQQLLPGSISAPPKGQPPTVPTCDTLLPDKMATGVMELNQVR